MTSDVESVKNAHVIEGMATLSNITVRTEDRIHLRLRLHANDFKARLLPLVITIPLAENTVLRLLAVPANPFAIAMESLEVQLLELLELEEGGMVASVITPTRLVNILNSSHCEFPF
jgi:hypothetical protein